MTEKQFRVQEHCLRSSYGIGAENWLVTNDNHSIVLNDKAEAHMVVNMCNDIIDVLNKLHEEKEFWKSNCVSQDNFNHILLHELDIAREQGYKVSNPFKKLIGEKRI